MKQKTCDIIMLCKGYGKKYGAGLNTIERIISYLNTDGRPKGANVIPQPTINDVYYELTQAAIDLSVSHNASRKFLVDMFAVCNKYMYNSSENDTSIDIIDSIVIALENCTIRDAKGNFTNGFTEELVEHSQETFKFSL